ncbi:hypothetical protein JMJ78_0000507 [Colletotrichum scovillei]|nr:hypothetical protein JMJ78_0000507 [Colletotrichum scovillei]
MASFVARRAFSTSIRRFADEQAKQTLTQESKRNPETLVPEMPLNRPVRRPPSTASLSPRRRASEAAGTYRRVYEEAIATQRDADGRAGSGVKTSASQESRNGRLIGIFDIQILGGVMVAALGGAGLYFGRSPTSSTSESPVLKAGMPWETDSEGKYKYHPGGNPANEPRDAPSAVNTVIIPDVTLPKELHEKYNKWGKDGYP